MLRSFRAEEPRLTPQSESGFLPPLTSDVYTPRAWPDCVTRGPRNPLRRRISRSESFADTDD